MGLKSYPTIMCLQGPIPAQDCAAQRARSHIAHGLVRQPCYVQLLQAINNDHEPLRNRLACSSLETTLACLGFELALLGWCWAD